MDLFHLVSPQSSKRLHMSSDMYSLTMNSKATFVTKRVSVVEGCLVSHFVCKVIYFEFYLGIASFCAKDSKSDCLVQPVCYFSSYLTGLYYHNFEEQSLFFTC